MRERNANTSITNTTFAQNRVFGSDFVNNGGGIVFSGTSTANILNSTLAYNRAGWVGGGISAEDGVQVNLKNTIFSKNTADNGGNPWNVGQHSSRPFNDQGGNFQWLAGADSSDNVTDKVTIADTKLGELQQVGNLWVYPLLPGSPAIDAAVAGAPTTDERGAARVGAADSGAYEFGASNPNPNSVSVLINDVSLTEGNSGTQNAVFTVNLSSTSNQTVSVDYATANGTAIADSDYTARSETLTFKPSETSKKINIPIIGNTIVEPNETFIVNLSRPSNATIQDSRGLGMIRNDDVASRPTPNSTISAGGLSTAGSSILNPASLPTNTPLSIGGTNSANTGLTAPSLNTLVS
ncbi:MAG: hypothetical protein HC866_04650 [Leptolyngbyaceae cyanobacterium RU_5_1]|nr:hypothetical protein [Leptolyngbyaceae cyanobacterium RU_5_1]